MRIADRLEQQQPASPGMLSRSGDRLFAACGKDTWLELLELQLEGKRRMPVEAFLNGFAFASAERLG